MKVMDWNSTSVKPMAFRSSPGDCWAIRNLPFNPRRTGHPGGRAGRLHTMQRVNCKKGERADRRMCEHFIARAAEPFRLDELWPFTERLERFGIAGFGWGAAWLGADSTIRTHRDVRAFRDDPG